MEQPVQALTCWAYLRSNRETSVAEVRLERGEGSWGKSRICHDCFPRWRGFCKRDMSEIFFFEMLKKTRVGIDFNS